ncbi:MAG: hypothetical protein ABII25_10325 [bacterium]
MMQKRNVLISAAVAVVSAVALAFVAPIKSGEDHILLTEKLIVNEKESRQFHFHNKTEGDAAPFEDQNPLICVLCHGDMPHAKNKVTRAMLNFHIPFTDCNACHVKDVKGGISGYRWFDGSSASIAELKKGERKVEPLIRIKPYVNQLISAFDEEITGRGSAPLITPYVEENGRFKMITMRMDDEKFARPFVSMQGRLTTSQQGIIKGRIHQAVSNPGLDCTDCHRVKSVLSFKALGYSEARMDQLVGTEAAGIIGRYGRFYIPSSLFGTKKGM